MATSTWMAPRVSRHGTAVAPTVDTKRTRSPRPSAWVWKNESPASDAKTARLVTSVSYSADPARPWVAALAATRPRA